MHNISATEWCSAMIRQQVQPGDLCVDATMGNGNDTLLLSILAGETGKVLAFDIQEQALLHTQEKLKNAHAPENYHLYLTGHEHISDYAKPDSVSCIVYNFGYLPGGDHAKSTHAETSLTALEQSLPLLKRGGILSLCIYSGGDSGFEERDAILNWLKNLNPKQYLVIRCDYFNRPNHPPIPVLVIRL